MQQIICSSIMNLTSGGSLSRLSRLVSSHQWSPLLLQGLFRWLQGNSFRETTLLYPTYWCLTCKSTFHWFTFLKRKKSWRRSSSKVHALLSKVNWWFTNSLSFQASWENVVLDLQQRASLNKPVTDADFNLFSNTMAGLWSVHTYKGAIGYQSNHFKYISSVWN